MKRIIQSTALMLALLLMSAPAWSYSYTDHVSQAPNGKGDVLVYPIYWSFGAFETKIQVINTSPNVSAIAKVVIRSPWLSEELLDFFIFLTPTDVWEGYLKLVDGKATLYSEDDSILVDLAPTFASPENPVSQPLLPQCDTDIFGYAEVFLTYVFPANYEDADGQRFNLTNPPVSKDVLYNVFVGPGSLINPIPLAGGTPGSYLDREWNILAGNQQIQNPAINWTSALNAVTLKDYRIFGLENVQQETVFGTRADNNMLEVEAALSKNNIGMPYINNNEGATFHWFNFPTKLTTTDDECRINGWRGSYAGFVGSPETSQTRWDYIGTTYSANIYDMKENEKKGPSPIFSPSPKVTNKFILETDFVVPSAYSKGWVRYNLDNGPTAGYNPVEQVLVYSGAPVIPVAMNIGAGGLSTMYGFYDDGFVVGSTEGVLPLYGYQYVRTFAFSPQASM